jgi:hypothetical protein
MTDRGCDEGVVADSLTVAVRLARQLLDYAAGDWDAVDS